MTADRKPVVYDLLGDDAALNHIRYDAERATLEFELDWTVGRTPGPRINIRAEQVFRCKFWTNIWTSPISDPGIELLVVTLVELLDVPGVKVHGHGLQEIITDTDGGFSMWIPRRGDPLEKVVHIRAASGDVSFECLGMKAFVSGDERAIEGMQKAARTFRETVVPPLASR